MRVLLSAVLSLLSMSLALHAQTIPTFSLETYASRPGGGFGVKADLNNDGVPDVLLCCDTNRNVWYQLSTGTGAFLAPVTLGSMFRSGLSIATGDFNKDRRADVAVPDPSGGIKIYYNQGGGVFSTKTYFGGSYPREIAVADFNHDNNLDIAFTENKAGSPVRVALGDGKGHFTSPTTIYSSSFYAAFELVVGDFDGDHNADLGFTLQACFRGGCNPSSVTILYGQGNGLFTAKTFPTEFLLSDVSSFDVNETGRSDLILLQDCLDACGNQSIGVFLGTGSRTLKQLSIQPQQFNFDFNRLAAADLNGDLKNDIIDSYRDPNAATGGTLFALATSLSSWDQLGEVAVNETGDQFSAVLAGDFNRDRKPDIVLLDGTSGVIEELVNTTVTGNYGRCSYPDKGQGIHVCSPTSGSIKQSPVRFRAAANSFQPIRKMELWIDGQKIKQQFRSWLDFTTSLPPGTHKVTIFANGYDDDFQRTSFLFTVN
jgi:hypothetical protein